jgi:FtsP/CotA-like multicopper oxidase with cupredoxin domain
MSPDHFTRSVDGLAEAGPGRTVFIDPGGELELTAAPVRKRIGAADVRLLAYNGSVPGPTLRVREGSEITVRFANELELDTTVHWHGLRHDYLFDGVPRGGRHGGMQDPVKPGGGFTYHLRFPDPGVYWYHPHMREDYTQEMGLYGNIIVEPRDPEYWPAAHRDLALVLDDILIEDGAVAPFRRDASSHTAMGRFGNVMLVNGETEPVLEARPGEVVRLYLTNTANTRVFRPRISGARMKLVGSDLGRVEQERMVERLLIAPSERWVVDVLFPEAGEFALEHVGAGTTYRLATFAVAGEAAAPDLSAEFGRLRHNPGFAEERARFAAEREREPDRVLLLQGDMPGMDHHGPPAENQAARPLIEWEDDMPEHNAASTPESMVWRIHDQALDADNDGIHWVFGLGDRVKIRIVNDPDSDHPMHHPVHFHGQRFYELEWDGGPPDCIMWKDTVLVPTGKTVDILLECGNPGSWMVHCHIAEHLEGGMMFTFEVRDEGEARATA